MPSTRIPTIVFAFLFFFTQHSFAKNKVLACDTAYAGADQQVCGDTAILNANTPLNGTGSWSLLSGSGTITNPSADSTSVTALTQGSHVFVWTISGGGCPTVTDTVVFLVDSIPTTSFAGNDVQLCGDSIVITGNTPTVGTGEWGLISGAGNISNIFSATTTVTNLGAGQNVFRWKISSGACASIDDVIITSDLPSPQAIAGTDLQICDTSFFLTGNTPPYGSGIWTLVSGSATINVPLNSGSSVSGMNFGDTASFTWTITNGVCPSTSDTVEVIINLPPTTANAGNNQTVCSDFTALAANTPAVGTGTWSFASGGGTISDTAAASISVTGLQEGANYLVWSITNGVCNASNDTVLVNNMQNSLPDAGPDQIICALSSTLSADTPVTGNGTWALVSGAGSLLFPSSPSTLVSNLAAGQNIFTWTISNGICPSRTDTMIITVNPPATTAFAGSDITICGSSTALSGSIPVNGTGTWSVITGTGTFANANAGSTTVSGLSNGTNTFVWSITNGTCPASTDTVNVISQLPPSIANAGTDTTICVDSLMLNANTPVTGTGAWTIVSTGPMLDSINDPDPIAGNFNIGQNVFVWTISNGVCPASSDTVKISVDENPTVADAGTDIETDQSLITLTGNTPTVGTGVWTNLGTEGNILTPASPNTSFIATESGEFDLVWTISNGVCPSTSDTLHIKSEFAPIPQVITPNGDGENDEFVIKSLQYTSNNIKLVIYNRWGNVVYTNDDYKHDFEGKNNAGVDLEEDSYFYHIEANGVERYKGYLIIKRK